jgi:NADH-quinone oxidoreductase subunit N
MNTLIAIIGLGVLCLLFEILRRKTIIPMTIIGLLVLDLISLNSLPPTTTI